jgi:small-conductance mechanosensitive channel
VFSLIVTVIVVQAVVGLIAYFLERYWALREKDDARKKAFRGVLTGVRIIIWVIALFLLLDNLGVKISALVTGLGIGGVAVALAAQAVLGDLFAFITIFFDRPFGIGDTITTGQHTGVVEHIGVKSTRIRSLDGEELVFRNSDLTNSIIRNLKRMERRRVLFRIGVTYDTSADTLKEIALLIQEIVEQTPGTRFERAHFASFGDFSLVFESVYFVLSSDYITYMDVQQTINLRIKQEFEKRKIRMAFPTQVVYIHQSGNQPE